MNNGTKRLIILLVVLCFLQILAVEATEFLANQGFQHSDYGSAASVSDILDNIIDGAGIVVSCIDTYAPDCFAHL